MDKVFAIVVTYNGEFWIRKCLDSLQNSSIPVQIIVVDNKSTDKTIEIIENEFSSIQLIKSEKNLGFGQGNNAGIQRALNQSADYVFLLNQDAWVEKDTIEKLIEVHRKNEDFGILSPFHLNYDGNQVEYYFSTIINPQSCPNLLNDTYFKKLNLVYEIEFIHAAAWLISANCLKTAGGFDPVFKLYSEDNDFINRVKYFKFRIGVVPASLVYHYGSHEVLYKYKFNIPIHLNIIILNLKNINHKFRGLFLVHLKTSFDKMTSALLYRRFKEFGFQLVLFYKSLFYLRKILKSRKITKQRKAYL